MKPLLLALVLFAAQALAQNYTLETALAKAKDQATVLSAQVELADAKANLGRVLSDPLLTKPSKVQAEQRVATAEASLKRSTAQAQNSIVSAYAQVLEAGAQVRLAQKAQDLSQRSLEVAQIRQKNGSGTALDVKNAQNRLEDSQKNLSAAESGLALAQSSLRSLIGPFQTLAALPAQDVPGNTVLKDLLAQNPDLVQSRQRVELAQMQVDLLDPSYAARADIDAAKARAEQAAQGNKEIERAFGLQYDSLYQQVQSAAKSLTVQQAALANARETQANDKKRLDSGLISGLVFLQTELSTLQAELGALQARGNFLRAIYSLYAGGR
jgi:outer membrane protein TolC